MFDQLVKYHVILPAPRGAWAWIASTFRGQIANITCGPRNPAAQAGALMRALTLGEGRAVVACPRGYPEEFSGWAVGMHGALLFAYVRHPLRRQGIGLELIGSVTPDDVPVVRAAYWTEDAEGMSRHGIPIAYDFRAHQALLAFVRGPEACKHRAAVAA